MSTHFKRILTLSSNTSFLAVFCRILLGKLSVYQEADVIFSPFFSLFFNRKWSSRVFTNFLSRMIQKTLDWKLVFICPLKFESCRKAARRKLKRGYNPQKTERMGPLLHHGTLTGSCTNFGKLLVEPMTTEYRDSFWSPYIRELLNWYSRCTQIFPSLFHLLFALLYLGSDSNTVPLADAKISGPCDAFKKGC